MCFGVDGVSAVFINFGSSVYYLIKRCATADIVALVCAEVGVVFCTVVLITGPIWRVRCGASGGRGTCG